MTPYEDTPAGREADARFADQMLAEAQRIAHLADHYGSGNRKERRTSAKANRLTEEERLFEVACDAVRLFRSSAGPDGMERFGAETVARCIWKALRARGSRVEWPADMRHGQ